MDQLGLFQCWIGNEAFDMIKMLDIHHLGKPDRLPRYHVAEFNTDPSVATPSLLQVLVLQLAPAVQLKIGR